MQNINSTQLLRLKHYIKTFNIKYTDISKELGLDNSTIGKYFNNNTKLTLKRYLEILDILIVMTNKDEMKLFIIENWLKVETPEQKKSGLKRLANNLEALSLELKDIIGE